MVAEAFGLDDETRATAWRARRTARSSTTTAATSTSRTYAPNEDEEGELIALECVVGENWVVTAHDEPIPVLEEFAERVSGSGDTGSLDGPGFLAALLEWVLGLVLRRVRADRAAAGGVRHPGDARRRPDAREDIERLVEMRQQVGKLRRALAAHRSALVSLTHPELEALGDHDSGERFSRC